MFLTQSVPRDSLVIYEETQLKIMPKKGKTTTPEDALMEALTYDI